MSTSSPDLASPSSHSPAPSTNDIMSSTNPHRTPRGSTRTPSAPNSAATTPIEPKSDYLRHMLESKRAQQATPIAPTPAPKSEAEPSASTLLRSASSDPWLDQARSEDEGVKITPKRPARRPSNSGRPRTLRELQDEVQKLKTDLFDLSMRHECIIVQNKELKDQVDELDARTKELEPLEDDNFELTEENRCLTFKVQNMTEELVQLRDHNIAILKIQEESVKNMDKQNAALGEAAEIIIRLEKEKAALARECAQLTDQLTEAQNSRTASSGTYHGDMDGTATKYPVRVHSIDESRPSTSHFDSDYYSQPASPQVKVSKESLDDVALSDRTKNFLSMRKDNHKSTQDLKKRLSDASMKGVRIVSSVPEVPPIPPSFQGQTQGPPRQPPHDLQVAASRTPRRIKPRHHLSPSAMAQAQEQPVRPASSGPQTPTAESKAGLRAMYHGNLTVDTSTRGAQHSPGYNSSPLATRAPRPLRQPTQTTLPDRFGIKHITTKPSRERPHDPDQETSDGQASEWASSSFPSPPSVLSDLTDLTTEPEEREGWWRDVGRLQQPLSLSSARTPLQKSDFALSMALAGAQPTRRPSTRAAHARTASSSQGAPPYMRTRDFLFNPSESEEDFMEHVTSFGTRR